MLYCLDKEKPHSIEWGFLWLKSILLRVNKKNYYDLSKKVNL